MYTVRKLSLGQGNFFTSVCLSTWRGGGAVGFPACITGQMTSIQGGLPPVGVFASVGGGGAGGLHLGEGAVCLHWGLPPGRGGVGGWSGT